MSFWMLIWNHMYFLNFPNNISPKLIKAIIKVLLRTKNLSEYNYKKTKKMAHGNSSSRSDPFGDPFALDDRLFIAFTIDLIL